MYDNTLLLLQKYMSWIDDLLLIDAKPNDTLSVVAHYNKASLKFSEYDSRVPWYQEKVKPVLIASIG